MAKKKYLVTGGAGLVGSHIVDALIARGDEVVVFDSFVRGKKKNVNKKAKIIEGDLRFSWDISDAMQGIDYVFHQAALCLVDCEKDPFEAIDVNIVGTVNLLDACIANGVKKIVAASSSSVYGEGYLPTDELHPFNNYLFYGMTKIADEQLLRAFYKKYGLDYVAFRYLNVYGPRMDSKGAYMSVIMNFINKLKAGEQPTINGDGTATMDMVYVKDVAKANLMAMDSQITNEVFNVASGQETTLNELLFTLAKLLKVEAYPLYVKRDERLVTHRLGCPKKAEKLLGFKCTTSLEDGLKEIIKEAF